MSALAEAIDAIAEILQAVPAAGSVHQFRRYLRLDGDIKAAYFDQASETTRAWEIYRKQTISTDESCGGGLNNPGGVQDMHAICLWFWFGVNDVNRSEIVARELVEAVRAVFHANRRLISASHPSPGAAIFSSPLQVVGDDMFMKAGMLLHRIDLEFQVQMYPAA